MIEGFQLTKDYIISNFLVTLDMDNDDIKRRVRSALQNEFSKELHVLTNHVSVDDVEIDDYSNIVLVTYMDDDDVDKFSEEEEEK